jgi:exodeoxyribonuclease V beta subunit
MKIFDLYNESLDGTKLIEASAGTGKTFTLSGLYIRFIIEKKLLPENILVLTFTKAATAELKTRLRNQLIECKNHLVGIELVKNEDDQALFNLYESYKSNEKALKYIEIALICFDQAAIYTINGFCQKVIDDYNSDCGSPVFHELINKKEHVKKYVYNFWRIQQKNTPSEFLAMMPSLDDTITTINSLLSKSHYHHIMPEIAWNDTEKIYKEFWNLGKKWQLQQETLLDYVLSGDFHGGTYKIANRKTYCDEMNQFFKGFEGNVLKFCANYIESKLGKKNTLKPMPEFFKAFEVFYEKLFYTYEPRKIGNNLAISYMYACFKFVQTHLSQLLIEQGQYDYSDQIKVVYESIKTNKKLVDKIADQWQCIMVDEFQDTDSMQLQIFETCFNDGKHDLIYVGDPKQAIYDFRGADVFVYNQAKQQTQSQYNLATNWRSSDRMLTASNAMFDYDNSFKFPWLTFTPSHPKPDQSRQLKDKYASVAIIDCDVLSRKIRLAEEIKRFLHEASIVREAVIEEIRESEDVGTDRTAIKPENCAILVNYNKQAIELYEYLLSVDISVSLDSDSSVFSTESAKHLYYFIRAINYPSKNHIFTTFHGLFFDVSLNTLQQLDSEDYKEQFVGYRLTSKKDGLMRVIDTVFNEKGVYKRLLQRIDGERHYTDLQHLKDLLQQQVDQGLNSNQLEQWLALQIQQTESMQDDDQRKRRIESDGKKISIMTIHKSKGLEFDHVFIPYADSISVKPSRKNINVRSCMATHDLNDKGVIYWKHSKTAQENNERERRAENSRNLYVALTRAKHRVYIGVDKLVRGYDKLPIADLLKQIEDNPALCSTVTADQVYINTIDKKDVELIPPKMFERFLDKPQSIYSFSALSKKQTITFEVLDEAAVEIDFSNYFQFPKGAKSGTMQHEILENVEFTAEMPEITTEVDSQLKRNNYDEQWSDCLSQQMYRIMNTDLWDNGPQMSQIQTSVDEMEFMLPIGSINNSTISKWLTIHRGKQTPFTQDNLQGFLTGFIDLVFEDNGKYYVVDYKSNYLGQNFSDYSDNDLKNAIEHHYYDLQYLLYSVALVKYLQINLDGFDYQQHFGGVAYLFTRGVNGTAGQGIYVNQPNQQLIEQMIGEFRGE